MLMKKVRTDAGGLVLRCAELLSKVPVFIYASVLARLIIQCVSGSNKRLYCLIWCCDTSPSHIMKHVVAHVVVVYLNSSMDKLLYLVVLLYYSLYFFVHFVIALMLLIHTLRPSLLLPHEFLEFDMCMLKQWLYLLLLSNE